MRSRRGLRALAILIVTILVLTACSKPLSHPSGWRPVDYHGTRLYVPSAWSVVTRSGDGVGCITGSPPSQPLVVLDQTPIPQNDKTLCALSTSRSKLRAVVIVGQVTPVSGLSESFPKDAAVHHLAGHPVTLHGLAGYYLGRGHAAADIWVGGFISYKSGVTVVVASTDQGLIQGVLTTVRPSPVSN